MVLSLRSKPEMHRPDLLTGLSRLICLLAILTGLHCFSSDALAEEVSLRLTNTQERINISPYLQYAQEDGGEYDPRLLLETEVLPWQENRKSSINLGYQRHAYWIRLDFHSAPDLPADWLLEQANPLIDSLNVYLFQAGVLKQSWQTGDRVPFHQRPLTNSTFVFPLNLEPDTPYQLIMRVQNTEAMDLRFSLMSKSTFDIYNTNRALLDGVFFGFLIIMAAYSFALFLNLWDRTYLYYVAYVLSMLLFFLSQQGYLYQFFIPQQVLLNHYGAAWVSLLIFISIALFFREFLALPTKVPRIWSIYKALLLAHALSCAALPFFDYQTVILVMVVNTSVSTLLAAASIIHLSLKGSRSAQIVLVGWALLISCLMLFVAARLGVFYNEFMADYGLRLGISFEILIFSFGLSFRINQERQEKALALQQMNQERVERVRAQELALEKEIIAKDAKEHALQLEIKQRENLEQLVADRTRELERTLANLEKANQELESLSTQDTLTGICNRRAFNKQFEEYWYQSHFHHQPLSLLVVDIDHFKRINDDRGHQCGDMVLKEFAALLVSMLKRPADCVSRYGGEEFAILLPDTPLTGAKQIADCIIRQAAAKQYEWQNESFNVTASIGLHSFTVSRDESCDMLFAKADSALYQAKQSGRNRWVAYSEQEDRRALK